MRKKDRESKNLSNRRSFILGGGALLLFGGITGRLYHLQINQAEKYRALANENRFDFSLTLPSRGIIRDRSGVIIANNRRDSKIIISNTIKKDQIDLLLNKLATIINLSKDERFRIKRQIKNANSKVSHVTLDYSLNEKDMSRIMVRRLWLDHVDVTETKHRHYPYGKAFGNVIGYIGRVSAKHQKNDQDPMLRHPDARIGREGIEKLNDKNLRGNYGVDRLEVRANGHVVNRFVDQPAVNGNDIVVTFDGSLQQKIYQSLEGRAAGVVVMDLPSGAVRALVSSPSFDPNPFVSGIEQDQWQRLLDDPLKPLLNKVIAGTYAPGSTIKPLIAAAALEAGIKLDHHEFCNGKWEYGNEIFHCWNRYGHGEVDMNSAIRQSCDVWFYAVAKRLGIKKIAAILSRFGLGADYGLFPGSERSGIVPTPEWKQKRLGRSWVGGETVISAIGQGYVLATPLQLAVMTARMATGRVITPYIIHSERRANIIAPAIDIDSDILRHINQSMIDVVNHPSGTAHKLKKIDGFIFAGKTGTSQVKRIGLAEREEGVRKNKVLPYKLRDHALFVSYGPIPNPRYAVSVIIEHGGSGSSTAAPIAQKIFEILALEKPAPRLLRTDQADINQAELL